MSIVTPCHTDKGTIRNDRGQNHVVQAPIAANTALFACPAGHAGAFVFLEIHYDIGARLRKLKIAFCKPCPQLPNIKSP